MRFVTVLVGAVMLGCGGTRDPGDYLVQLVISGTSESWNGVQSVTVEGKAVRWPPTPIGPNRLQTGLSLCTTERDVFLQSDALTAEVTLSDGRVMRSPIERLACHVARDPGHFERIEVELQLDGNIDADYGSKPSIFDTCALGASSICAKNEL